MWAYLHRILKNGERPYKPDDTIDRLKTSSIRSDIIRQKKIFIIHY